MSGLLAEHIHVADHPLLLVRQTGTFLENPATADNGKMEMTNAIFILVLISILRLTITWPVAEAIDPHPACPEVDRHDDLPTLLHVVVDARDPDFSHHP